MNTSFQGRRYHDLKQVKAWLEPNLHKILKWSLFCNLYQNISKIDNERKKSVGLLFLSHEKPHTCATWPVQERKEKTKILNYGVVRCHIVEFKYSDFVIVSLLLT